MNQQSTTTLPFRLDIMLSRSSDEDTWKRNGARLLPLEFQPAPSSVIIGRAKKCKEAVGNRKLRVLAELHLPAYSGANCKVDKSMVVTSLVNAVRACCPVGGAFIKYRNNRWWELENTVAREKVGYVLRDLLSDRYRSSSKSKVARRKEERIRTRGCSTGSTTSENRSEAGDSTAESDSDDGASTTSGKADSNEGMPSAPSSNIAPEVSETTMESGAEKKNAWACPILDDDDDQFDLLALLDESLINW